MNIRHLPTLSELYVEYQSGLTLDNIAAKYGCMPNDLHKAFKRAGYKLRSRSEALKLYNAKKKEVIERCRKCDCELIDNKYSGICNTCVRSLR